MPTMAATMSGNIIDMGLVDFYRYSIISNEVFLRVTNTFEYILYIFLNKPQNGQTTDLNKSEQMNFHNWYVSQVYIV